MIVSMSSETWPKILKNSSRKMIHLTSNIEGYKIKEKLQKASRRFLGIRYEKDV